MERCAYSDGVRLVDSRQDCAKLLSGDEETLGKHLFGAQKHAQIVQTKAAEACSNKIVLVIFYSGWCQPSSLLGCMLSKTTLGNLIFFCRPWHHLVEISGTSGLHKTIGEKEMQMEKRNDVYSVGKTGCVSPTLSPFNFVCPCVPPWFLYFVVVAPSPLLTFSFFVEYFHARTA